MPIHEDPRTEEQIEEDRQGEAQALTYRLFGNVEFQPAREQRMEAANPATPEPVDPHQQPEIISHRIQARRRSVQLRRRT